METNHFKQEKRYLLVTRIGRKSLHEKWLSTNNFRKFDVLLSAYDSTVKPIEAEGVFFEYRKGPKVEGYNGVLEEHGNLLKNYQYICFWDEDLECTTETLNDVFAISEKHKLKISQPSLTWDSYFTYAATLKQPGIRLRYVNYIEMMCPVFRCDVLQAVAPLFSLGMESGIDLVWCNLVAEGEKDFAVLDCAPIRHTEPVGGNKSANGFVGGKTYEDDIYSVLRQFNIPWLSCVPYSAVTVSGREIKARWVIFMSALNLLFSIPLKPRISCRLRAVAVHLRHILIRKPKNIRISYQSEFPRG